MILHPLDPIICAQSRILILGSFPSVISRKQEFYYANPSNRFWKMLALLFEEEIGDRSDFICSHQLALWDVVESCDIVGSSDATIKQVTPNAIRELLTLYPIECIVLNGKTAEKCYKQYFSDVDIEVLACPSTSSANAKMHLTDLVHAYRRLRYKNYEKD